MDNFNRTMNARAYGGDSPPVERSPSERDTAGLTMCAAAVDQLGLVEAGRVMCSVDHNAATATWQRAATEDTVVACTPFGAEPAYGLVGPITNNLDALRATGNSRATFDGYTCVVQERRGEP